MLHQGPSLIQTQTQKLSPQMLQTVKLMALPIFDLKAAIAEELERNPALEVKETETSEKIDTQEYSNADIDLKDESSDPGYRNRQSETSINEYIEATQSRKESLTDHLVSQLKLCKISERETEIGEILINNLDNKGFHINDPEIFFNEEEYDTVHKVIELINRLDPVGVCVSNIEESLLVQTKVAGNYPKETVEILTDSIDLLTKGKKKLIAEKHNLTLEELEEVYDFLKTLNPHPTAEFETGYSKYIIPEAKVIKEEGKISVYLKNEALPSLSINQEFNSFTRDSNKEVKKFAKQSVNSANSFIQSIIMRNSTLLKTVNAIVKKQRAFFLFGPGNVKPLTRKEIAQETELSESTISRITSDKYIQTDWGIYNLKYFFPNAVSSSQTGRDHSKESVKEIVKQIILENKSEKKLSDQKISNILKERGITLARRTVSKYRKELNLLSSYDRQ